MSKRSETKVALAEAAKFLAPKHFTWMAGWALDKAREALDEAERELAVHTAIHDVPYVDSHGALTSRIERCIELRDSIATYQHIVRFLDALRGAAMEASVLADVRRWWSK